MRRMRFVAVTAAVASVVGLGMATSASAAPSVRPDGSPPAVQGVGDVQSLSEYMAGRKAHRKDAGTQAKDASIQAVECDVSVALTIWSVANSRFVSVELGYTGSRQGMLRARSTTVDYWELFFPCFDDTYTYIYPIAAKRYVSAELEYTGSNYGMLRARATAPNVWEAFVVDCASDYCTFQSAGNNRYFTAELGYTGGNYGMLRARATTVDLWEKFL